jgi:hypothetical protein
VRPRVGWRSVRRRVDCTVSAGGGGAVFLGPLAGAHDIDAAGLILRGQSDEIVGWSAATGDMDADGEVDLAIGSLFPSGDSYIGAVDVVTPVLVYGL